MVLDAHTDLVTASSVSEPFQVIISTPDLKAHFIFVLSQGFDVMIDSRMEYPLVSMNKILIRPGHIVKSTVLNLGVHFGLTFWELIL